MPASAPSQPSAPRNGALRLSYDRGSVLLSAAADPASLGLAEVLRWDERVPAWRGLARDYRAVVRALVHAGAEHLDEVRAYPDLPPGKPELPPPHPYQEQALAAWRRGKRGVVELPTGAGKTYLALLAMAEVGRGTLVLVPTLDLAAQWAQTVERALGVQPGLIGGGSFEVAPVTVCTYASAHRHAERFGNRFALAVFDECHHLSAEGFSWAADALIAPYRLGLSATVERPDDRHRLLDTLIGPVVYRQGIRDLQGRYLSPYRVETLYAQLDDAEQAQYAADRETYLAFTRKLGLTISGPRDWQRFVFAASRSAEGREALAAFHRQKRVAYAAADKFALCERLLHDHRGERVLVFTNDNDTAHAVSRRFLVPLITHHTRVAERKAILQNFRDNHWPVLATSKVLNEGVDVPAASVAIILSGNASVREHVQRLGRILRKEDGKQAVLYEILTRATGEESTSRRRRRHDAYR